MRGAGPKSIVWGLLLAGALGAQAQQFSAGGVYVDADGLLRLREVSRAQQLREHKKQARRSKQADPTLCYISLPRLLADARKQVEAGEPIPPRTRFLEGMVKLQYVFVHPDEKDLVIAGRAEDWDTSDSTRPLGLRSGRPLLRLEDLVVALRTTGPKSQGNVFGCSIDLTQDALDRMVQAARRIGAVPRSGVPRAANTLVNAVGPQKVRFFGVEPATPLAFVCLEADYLLKRLSLGLLPSPVRAVRSHLSMMGRGENMYSRFWFAVFYKPLLVSDDGLAFEIRGQPLRVLASDSLTSNAGSASRSARRFAESVTTYLPALEAKLPEFADLANVTDLALLAALIASDKLHEKISWDLTWVLDPAGYPVTKVTVPLQAQSLVNFRPAAGRANIAVGGVQLSMSPAVTERQSDSDGLLEPLDKFPGKEQWFLHVKQ